MCIVNSVWIVRVRLYKVDEFLPKVDHKNFFHISAGDSCNIALGLD